MDKYKFEALAITFKRNSEENIVQCPGDTRDGLRLTIGCNSSDFERIKQELQEAVKRLEDGSACGKGSA